MSDDPRKQSQSNITGFFMKRGKSGMQQAPLSPTGQQQSTNQTVFSAMVANQTFTNSLTISQFKEELSQIQGLEEKFNLLKTQFPQELFKIDLAGSHPGQQPGQTAQLSSNITWIQVEMISILLAEVAQIHSSPHCEQSSQSFLMNYSQIKPAVAESVMLYLAQLQQIVALAFGKLYNQFTFQEILQTTQSESAPNPRIFNDAILTIGEWCHFLIASHSQRLKPGFVSYVSQRLSDTMQYMISQRDSIKSSGSKNTVSIDQMMMGTTHNLSQSNIMLSQTATVIPKVEQRMYEEVKQAQHIEASEGSDDVARHEQIEASLLSITITSCALLQTQSGQGKQQENIVIQIVMPLMKVLTCYEPITQQLLSLGLQQQFMNMKLLFSRSSQLSDLLHHSLKFQTASLQEQHQIPLELLFSSIKETSITLLVLRACHLFQTHAKARISKGGPSFQVSKSDFTQTLLTLMGRNLQAFIASYIVSRNAQLEVEELRAGLGAAIVSGNQKLILDALLSDKKPKMSVASEIISRVDDEKIFPLIFIISEGARKDTFQHIIGSPQALESREAQINWVKVCQTQLSMAIDFLTSQPFGQTSQLLLKATFDTFKSLIFFLCHYNLLLSEENFAENGITLISDIIDYHDTKCPIIATFQIIMSLAQSDNKALCDAFYSEFEELSGLILKGHFDMVDSQSYMQSVYMVFLDKLITSYDFTAQNNHQSMADDGGPMKIVGYLFDFFTRHYCSESRLKDIESLDYLRNKASYLELISKFRAVEARHSDEKQFSAAREANRALIQQHSFELISYFAHFMPKVNEMCLQQILKVVVNEQNDTNPSRLFQHLKLAISIMQKEGVKCNKDYYEKLILPFTVLGDETGSTQETVFITWSINSRCKGSDSFLQFWVGVCSKLKAHLLAKIMQSGKDGSQISVRQEAMANLVLVRGGSSAYEGMLSEGVFSMLKKMLIYGVSNLDLASMIYKQMKELLKEVKDFEHSFEIKLAIHSTLLVSKDRQGQQDDVLRAVNQLLLSLLKYIDSIDKNYGKPQSSAKRSLEGASNTWEQERLLKVKQIKTLVAMAIRVVSNYIDYKESAFALDGDNRRQLDMIANRRENFELVVTQLKKVVLRSQMHGAFLIQQLMRIFFFDRRELQNLCLVVKNANNDLLLDAVGPRILESALLFMLEGIEQLSNANSLVKSFVQVLQRNMTGTNKASANLKMLKFARSLNAPLIRQIKRIMIYIREKDETMKDVGAQFKDLIVQSLCKSPRTLVYKEFFSFLREIFYYSRDMDTVDYDLACDVLQIINQVLKASSLKQIREPVRCGSLDYLHMMDSFAFSDMAPGVILSETLRIPQESFSVALLFKLNIPQIRAMQERSGGAEVLTMTFFQIIDKANSDAYPPVSIIVNVIKDKLKINDFECKLDESWHLLLVQFDFKNKLVGKTYCKIKIFIDSLSKPINSESKLQHSFHKNHEHFFAYGCDAIDIMGGLRPSAAVSNQISMSMQMIQPVELNQEFKSQNHFQGSLSMVFMYTKFELEKLADPLKRTFVDFLIEHISRKQTVSVGTYELVNYFKARGKMPSKDSQLGTFESHDFNEEVIVKHQRGCSIDHLATVHGVRPHDTIVVIGGFKSLYPVFEKSMQSNLTLFQKAEIWTLNFKILRTFMNIDPSHVLRLFKSKYLIESLRSCIVRGGLTQNLITIELLMEIISIAKDSHTNRHSELLEDFYIRYVFEVILNETFCDLSFIDRRINKRSKIFEVVAESLYKMYIDEEQYKNKEDRKNKQISQNNVRAMSNESTDRGDCNEFFSVSTAFKIYNLILKLIIRYPEPEYIKHTKKLAVILMKIIIRDEQKENFERLIISIQMGAESKKSRPFSKATLLAHLKILEGVIKNPQFYQSHELYGALKATYRKEMMEQHLNQSPSLFTQSRLVQEMSDGKLEDEIIAITLRIIIDVQIKLYDHPRQIMPPRHGMMGYQAPRSIYEEEKPQFINQLYRSLSMNPRGGIQMQKTLCSLIITSLERKKKLIVKHASSTPMPVKYNPAFLKECLKDRDNNNVLEIMRSSEFDHQLFGLTISLFKMYDTETKLIFLEFYRQLIEESSSSHNIEDFNTFKDKNFLVFLKDLQAGGQETYILNIVSAAIKTREPQIISFVERIVASTIKCFFNTSLQRDIEGVINDEEFNFLKIIKKLFIILEPSDESLLAVINEVLKYVQEVVNWVWSYVLHDSNRTNLNLKLLLFLQQIEEIFMKKLGHSNQEQALLHNEVFYEVLARLMIVFEDTKILYFDYPNPQLIETNKRNTMMTGMIRTKETMLSREVNFALGGPMRIFLSILLQMIRKIRPNTDPNSKTVGSEGNKSDHYSTKSRPKKVESSFEHYQYFDCALEIFRFFIFKEESSFVTQFRPVPTIEPPTEQGINQAPLFKMIYNTNPAKRNLYVLQPLDLTKQFIEDFNESAECKDSVVQTPGFLPLVLINETHEIIRRKLSLYQNELQSASIKGDRQEESQRAASEYQHQLIQLLGLLYDIMRNAYMSEEFKENVGYMMITITDPRIKEELYSGLTSRKLQQRGRGPHGKLYFLGKAADLYYQNRQNINESNLIGSETGLKQQSEADGLLANLQEGHFMRQSDRDAIASQYAHRNNDKIDKQPGHREDGRDEETEEDRNAEGFFTDAALIPIQIAEERERFEAAQDYSNCQEELISFLTRCYTHLHDFFAPQRLSSNVTTPGMSDTDFINQFRDDYILDTRSTQIILALRLVSSEKFRHVHSFSFSNREELEIKKQIRGFQVVDTVDLISNYELKQKQPIVTMMDSQHSPMKGIMDSDGNMNYTPMTQSQQSVSSMKNSQYMQREPMTGQFADNQVIIPMSARKRSDESERSGFEFPGSNDDKPDSTPSESLGKPSLSSTSRGDLQQTTVGSNRMPDQNESKYRTLEHYFCKQQYKKTVKRLMEDPSSIWYDNLEQMKKDYQDIKEVYDIVSQINAADQFYSTPSYDTPGGTPGPIASSTTVGQEHALQEESKVPKSSNQPQQPANNNGGFKPKQYDHFVRIRRNADLWGRMMLLKPDRKYKQRKFLISHKYFVHDVLKNLFAVSLLDDSDFPDYQQILRNLEQQEMQKLKDETGDLMSYDNPQEELIRRFQPKSEQFKRIRELLMSKIEQNDFLYTLLTNLEEFANEDQKFDFHPITDTTVIWKSKEDVQYISVEGAQCGVLYLSAQYLMFKSKCERINRSQKFAMKRDEIIKKRNKTWHITGIEQVFKRRFVLLHQACEFYTQEKKSYFFNLLSEESCTEFFQRLSSIVKSHNKGNSKKIEIIEKAKGEFKTKKFVEDWQKGDKSTQEFLLLVNKYSGRSFNDFGQYPIFPWIISDYGCSYEELKQKTEKLEGEGFRDLTKNSGVLTEKKLDVAQKQYESQIEGDEMIYGSEPYHLKFGFSNRVFCLGYLIRMEPFTDNFIKVNGGLDNPDRIFYSFIDQWKSILEDKQNNCELTPEFFYFPEMFRNHNLSYLGKSRSNLTVNEVILPTWSKNEHDFIRIHREVLESKIVAKKIRFWIDLLFGSKQKDETQHNLFYSYAYESHVKSIKDEIQDHNIETILEFLQVPQQLFTEALYKVDKKQIAQGVQSIQMSQQVTYQIPEVIDEENEDQEDDQLMRTTSQKPLGSSQSQGRVVSMQTPGQLRNKLANKISQQQRLAHQHANSKTSRETESLSSSAGALSGQNPDYKNASLIQKFIQSVNAPNNNKKRFENELKNIQESHKIEKPEERNIFHMVFSKLNGRCFVFLSDKDTSAIRCVACRESFLQEELRQQSNLGLKLQNLRGDFNNIFQLYGGGLGDKGATTQKSPLLFTCQNPDNSIKVFDLSIKKGSQLVYQERSHHSVVTSIKFSSDFKYFISGDHDGVIHHYQRIYDDSVDMDMSQSVLQTPTTRLGAIETSQNNKCFPFTLKSKFQDQYGSILAIDINYTLDLYVTASRDGTIALRCLRTSQLWKVITLEKLQQQSVDVLTLKLSLHGYIVIMMKGQQKVYTFVYSINGDNLVSTQRESEQFEFKYAELTKNEDNMIMVFNQKLRKEDKEMSGVIRVCRLYDLEKDRNRDNLQNTFYPMIRSIINGDGKDSGHKSSAQISRRTGLSENLNSTSKVPMPALLSFALSQDESKMNLFLSTGEIICFDESRSEIIVQLQDFGLD